MKEAGSDLKISIVLWSPTRVSTLTAVIALSSVRQENVGVWLGWVHDDKKQKRRHCSYLLLDVRIRLRLMGWKEGIGWHRVGLFAWLRVWTRGTIFFWFFLGWLGIIFKFFQLFFDLRETIFPGSGSDSSLDQARTETRKRSAPLHKRDMAKWAECFPRQQVKQASYSKSEQCAWNCCDKVSESNLYILPRM